MKRVIYYCLTLGFCLLMSCLHAGVKSKNPAKWLMQKHRVAASKTESAALHKQQISF